MFNLRLALILALATLSGCETTDRLRFEDMSEYELVLHNALLPEMSKLSVRKKCRIGLEAVFDVSRGCASR